MEFSSTVVLGNPYTHLGDLSLIQDSTDVQTATDNTLLRRGGHALISLDSLNPRVLYIPMAETLRVPSTSIDSPTFPFETVRGLMLRLLR